MSEELHQCPETYEEAQSREELLHHLAACLKNRRLSKDFNLEEASLALKLRTTYLEALESGNWEEMPGEVYALGFLKQYAAYLGLDVSDSIEKLKTGDYKLTKPLTFPDPPIAPNRSWVIIAALAFVVLFILVNIFGGGEAERVELPMAAVTELQPSPDIAPLQGEQGAEEKQAAASESSGAVSPPPPPPVPEEDTVAAIEHEYRLSAIGGDVWLQISTDPDEGEASQMLQEALLKDGESLVFRNEAPNLLVTCGNAAALQVEVDGDMIATAGSLGDVGKVLRNFSIAAK